MIHIDIVITLYNRETMVVQAIESALAFLNHCTGQVIVVDDASKDQSSDLIKREYAAHISANKLKLYRLDQNIGVTGAKNFGFNQSNAQWVIFLDSDDILRECTSQAALITLKKAVNYPIVFFRCVTEKGEFVGQAFCEDQNLNLVTYLEHTSFGEALTVIQKNKVKDEPYDADLRGYEGLGCARLIKEWGPALLSTHILRIYNCGHENRLSAQKSMQKRSKILAKGHRRFLFTFFSDMNWSQRIKLALRILFYTVRSFFYVHTS